MYRSHVIIFAKQLEQGDWNIKYCIYKEKQAFFVYVFVFVFVFVFKVAEDVGQMSQHYHCISSHYSAHKLASLESGGLLLDQCWFSHSLLFLDLDFCLRWDYNLFAILSMWSILQMGEIREILLRKYKRKKSVLDE